MLEGFMSHHSSARDQLHQDDDDCDNEEYMDKAAHREGAHHSEQPEDDEDNCNCIKHWVHL